MKWRFRYLVILLLALTAFAQSPANPPKVEQPKPTKTEQRFTMLNATVMVHDEVGTGVHQESQVLLLDSETGRVWVYNPQFISSNKETTNVMDFPASFYRVYVDGIDDPSEKPTPKTYDASKSK